MTGAADPVRLDALRGLTTSERLEAERELVAPHFDAAWYASAYPQVAAAHDDLLGHFCESGWQDLLKPSVDFDPWWYWVNHLDPGVDDLNPLVHYALVGREAGLSTRPQPDDLTSARPGTRLPADRPVRRAALVAGYDAEGVVDEAVLLLLRDLARFADVFYLADGYLPAAELAKVRAVATEAWAVRHGAYDFGSYSLLARDLVGWERLADYDEVLFVNDSCYLVRPLDDVFATMSARETDWWGLQATKGLASTLDNPANHFTEPIPLDGVRSRLPDWEEDAVYDFHVGSYFLAFRRPVLDDERFRRLVDSVHPQRGKLRVILKYEIGLTHLLAGAGYAWDTYVPALYPFHPLFSEWAFTLLEQGFPLFKRYFIFQNHYDVPGLARWKERLLAAVPDAPVDVFEENLLRTAPDDRLRRSFAIERAEDGEVKAPVVPMGRAFAKKDAKATKRDDWWVFAVDATTHVLPESSRAMIEHLRDDPSITPIVLTRSHRVDLTGTGAVVVPLLSPEGRDYLAGARTVVVNGWPRRAVSGPLTPEHHDIIAVRDGLMLERTGRAAARPEHPGAEPRPPASGPMQFLHDLPDPTLTAVLAASDLDQIAAVATHWPVRYGDAWRTGLPFHDLLRPECDRLPADVREQEDRLRAETAGRRLLLLAPTARRTGTDREPYRFTDAEVAHLASWARQNDAVLGIREPLGDLERAYSARFDGVALDLSPHRYPSTPAVLRAADALLTDYSGTALDFLVTGRPVVSFAHDLDTAQDRLLYDLDHLFPGPVCRDFDALAGVLPWVFDPDEAARRRYRRARGLLLDEPDGGATARVVERMRALAERSRR